MTWYGLVFHGGAASQTPRPAKGPFKSEKEAEAAIQRFKAKYTHMAGEYLTVSCPVLYKYETRKDAREDIAGQLIKSFG